MSVNSENRTGFSGSSAGRWTVAAMIGFGVLMVISLYAYWYFHTQPFRELTQQIAVRFPDSRPNVVGGRYKSHESGWPETLRVIVQIPESEFDPETEPRLSESRALELATLAFRHQKMTPYRQMEIHLVQRRADGTEHRWSAVKPVSEWSALVQSGGPAYPAQAHSGSDTDDEPRSEEPRM